MLDSIPTITNKGTFKCLIWNAVQEPYQGKIDTMLEEAKSYSNLILNQHPSKDINDLINDVASENFDYQMILHRNEHGLLHLTNKWLELIKIAQSKGIIMASFDFGYFEHYKNFMFDYYRPDGSSSIHNEWKGISEELDWKKIQPSIQEYRSNILKKNNIYKEKDPVHGLESNKYIVIWTQWTTDLIRRCFYENGEAIKIDKWTELVAEKVIEAGFTPVIKLSPVKNLKPFVEIQKKYITFLGREAHKIDLPNAVYEKDINAKLIAHAHSHIINCSSVSNELVLTNSKVTAMGRSWFDNLGIFYEPKTWDELMDYKQPSQANINKWINWWNGRQFSMENSCEKLINFYDQWTNT